MWRPALNVRPSKTRSSLVGRVDGFEDKPTVGENANNEQAVVGMFEPRIVRQLHFLGGQCGTATQSRGIRSTDPCNTCLVHWDDRSAEIGDPSITRHVLTPYPAASGKLQRSEGYSRYFMTLM